MRIFGTALILAFALASSAFAGNVAPLGTVTCGTSTPCEIPGFLATYAIDGNPATKWVAYGSTTSPYLLLNLGQLYTVDSVTITGSGTPFYSIGFSVYVGTSSSPGTLIGSKTEAAGASPWSDTFSVSTSSKIQYVLYNVTGSFISNGATYEYPYASEISVDAVPEPGTVSLIGAGLLALGFTLRSRKK
jgi:hypothetical protein